jgi:hypothetical protein
MRQGPISSVTNFNIEGSKPKEFDHGIAEQQLSPDNLLSRAIVPLAPEVSHVSAETQEEQNKLNSARVRGCPRMCSWGLTLTSISDLKSVCFAASIGRESSSDLLQ